MANGDTRDAKLRLGVETKGVDKSVNDLKGLDREIDKLTKDIRQGFDKSVNSVEALTDEIRGDLVGALKEADKVASGIEVKSGGSGGGNAPAAAKFRGAASLIGGGEIVGLIDDLQDLGEGLVQLKSAAPGAVDGIMKLASSIGSGGLLAAGAAGIALVALGLAIKSFADEQAKAQAVIEGIVDAQREIDQKINAGATTADLNAERELLIKNLEDEKRRLKDLNAQYDAQFKGAGTEGEGFVDPFVQLLSGAEEGLANSINKTGDNIGKLQSQIDALNNGYKDSDLAANDAKTSEQELAQVRQTETPRAIDSAANAERERAKVLRDQERAVEQQARAQEQANREQQQQAEKAAAAQTKYNEAIASAGTQLKQATADINTKLSQTLSDSLTGLFRDVSDLSEQFRRDTFDADLKANQAERDALTDHLRDIDDIREEGRKSEREAIQEGDFKQLFLARQSGSDALRQEQKETQREGEDRRRGLQDERGDLLRASQRERSDRQLAYERTNADSRTAAQRELQMAQTARTRSLEAAANAYRAELAQLGQYLQQRNALQQQANQQALQQQGRSGNTQSATGISGTGSFNASQTIPQTYLGMVIRK